MHHRSRQARMLHLSSLYVLQGALSIEPLWQSVGEGPPQCAAAQPSRGSYLITTNAGLHAALWGAGAEGDQQA